MAKFENGQAVRTAYRETLVVLEQVGNVVYFYGAKPVHASKVFAI